MDTTPHAVIVGLGQIGRTLGEGLLMAGYTVTPVLHGRPFPAGTGQAPVIVATGEDDLAGALAGLPGEWKDSSSVVLLQNELLPSQWEPLGIRNPTIFVVWFERKPGQLIVSLRPSVVYGPQQEAVKAAMDCLALPCEVAPDAHEAMTQLIVKNVYIWATNIASLRTGGTTGELAKNHFALVRALALEALQVQESVMGQLFDTDAVMDQVVEALKADPTHRAGGRSAQRRLERFLARARQTGVAVPAAEEIAGEKGVAARP